jgi:uncharacterized Fe-S cluster-containing protein
MSTEVMIHVRFAPDGAVEEIGERPAGCTAQQWFNLLARERGLSYLALSGGRALFRIAPEAMDSLRESARAGVAHE